MKECITHHGACDCREARFKRMEEALNKIACWEDGPEVTPSFDCPSYSRLAREALGDN